jgi:small subunit ribosomal protein S18
MAKKDKDAKKKRRRQEVIKVPTNCPFCAKKVNPDYKDYKTLAMFITERAKIIGIARSGVCAKHQRRLTVAIKRARHLGLLPFTPSI